MTLAEILIDLVNNTTERLSLDQLTTLVENHTEWRGKSKGKTLRTKIISAIKSDPQFAVEKRDNNLYIGLKIGRLSLRADLDIS